MSEPKDIAVVESTKSTSLKPAKRVKRMNLELRASLRKNKFDPITQLVNVYPLLTPELQAKVCLDLVSYLAPKLKAIEPDPKPSAGSRPSATNVQVNVHPASSSPTSNGGDSKPAAPLSLQDLYAIAASTTKDVEPSDG